MFINKKTALLFFSVLLHGLVFSQQPCTGKFSGTVQSETGELLPGAIITLLPGQAGNVSDNEGRFAISNLCSGQYTLTIQYIGYKTYEGTITIGQEPLEKVLTLQTKTQQLQEVVVQETPALVEHSQNFVRLGEKQLAESAGKTLGESLKEIPGVNTIQAGPGIFKPVIHGVHSQRILILNYGIRQEGQQWGAEHAPEIDPFIASEIIVVKDASSIKYGTDALGGVIIVNPAPLPEKNVLGGSVSTVLQSNGRSGALSGMIEGGIKDHDGWGWRVQGTAKRAGDFRTPDYSLTNTGVKELNFSAATGYHREHVGFEVFFSHFQSELGILKGTSIGNLSDLVTAMEREPPQYTRGFSYNISEPRQDVSHNLLKLNGHIHTDHGEFRIQYGFQNNNRKEYDIRIGALSRIPSINLQLNTHTVETEWEIAKENKRSLCVGLTGMYQDNNNVYGTQRVPFIPNFNSLSGGAFAVTKLFFRRWTADIGVRYDYRHYDVTGYDFKNTLYKGNLDFHNASATAGASIQLSSQETFSTNLSSAWRPPHVAELYSLGTHQSAAAIEYGLLLNDSTNEVMDIKDVPFKIEQALKWVNTYRRNWDRFQVEASAYANYIFNYIYLKPTGITENVRGVFPYFRYTQTDALFLGLDLSAIWQLTPHIKISPKASLLRASDERNHDYLVFIPSNRYELAARFEASKRFALKDFYVESKVKYTARQDRSPRVVSVREINEAHEQGQDPFNGSTANFDFMEAPSGYALWNVSTGFSLHGKKTRYDLRASAENILNTSYREYTNRFRYYADDLGRNFILSVKCIF
jgi:iron complex outermembrane receptor protein